MRFLMCLPSRAVIWLIRLYQMFLSPLLGRHCRFEPTCSRYFIQAVQKYGLLRGIVRGYRGSSVATLGVEGVRPSMTVVVQPPVFGTSL